MSFVSVLEKVGKDFEKGIVLILGDASTILTAEAPTITAINPNAGALATKIAALATQAAGIASQTEQKFTALGQATGTTAQKIAEGTMILLPAVGQILGLVGEQASSVAEQIMTGAFNVLSALPQSVLTSTAPAVVAAATSTAVPVTSAATTTVSAA